MNDRPVILVVDDEALNIQLLYETLNDEYEILAATSGAELFARLEHAGVDLILLDVVMPDEDGFELCRRLKRGENTRDIPVIFITSMSEDENEAQGLEAGAVDYIRKPFFLPIVRARVRTHIELKRKTGELARLAELDSLTCLANRRKFDQALESEWKRARRSSLPFSVAMIDVDFFKQYNDNFGHVEGDACLREIAELMQGIFKRSGDLISRYGGEEFAVIMPNTDPEAGRRLCRELLKGMETLARAHPHSAARDHVTVSVGLVTIARPDLSGILQREALICADRMLYLAKQRGRARLESTELRTLG
ncbi:MAG TPA: diguanylate cyclase [Rectinemataceae bacterium]|nr:diguanylate cyclase [Rectinemataceae bacterium]